MSYIKEAYEFIRGDDHWVSLVTGLIAMVLCAIIFSIPLPALPALLLVGALVSGVTEMLIKEVPSDPENYDEDQYILWDAAFGDGTTTKDEYQEKLRKRAENKTVQEIDESRSDGLDTLRDRYARGELTEEQFERKLDHLLETETPENAEVWRTDERESIKE